MLGLESRSWTSK